MGRSDDCSSSFCNFCCAMALQRAAWDTSTTSSARAVSDLKKHAMVRLRSSACAGCSRITSTGVSASRSSMHATRRRVSSAMPRTYTPSILPPLTSRIVGGSASSALRSACSSRPRSEGGSCCSGSDGGAAAAAASSASAAGAAADAEEGAHAFAEVPPARSSGITPCMTQNATASTYPTCTIGGSVRRCRVSKGSTTVGRSGTSIVASV